VIAPPAADFATWYQNAIPGPSQSCTTSSGSVPTFDGNYPTRDNSVLTAFDLTPATRTRAASGGVPRRRWQRRATPRRRRSPSRRRVAFLRAGRSASGSTTRHDRHRRPRTTTWTVTRASNSTTAASHVISQASARTTRVRVANSLECNDEDLTVTGTIYIDGSAKISNSAVNTTTDRRRSISRARSTPTLTLRRRLRTTCNFAGWNPDTSC